MSDTIRRFLFEDLDIRGAWVRLDVVWQNLMTRRGYPVFIVELLGQMSTTAVLIADNLKHPGRLTLQLRGDGPVSLLVVDCGGQMNLRCMAHHDEGIVPAPFEALFGHGKLLLSTDSPKQPYQSVVPLEGTTIAEIFERYLLRSEQIASRFFLAASESAASGLYLQKMPAASERDADGWTRIEALAATVKREELLALPCEELLTRLFHEETVRMFEPRVVTQGAPLLAKQIDNILLSLPREEVYENLQRNGVIVITDELSNYEYRFERQDIDRLFSRMPEVPRSVH